MDLLQLTRTERPTVQETVTVYDAVQLMVKSKVGALAVTSGEKLVGIFTERDLMKKVVAEERPARSTKVSDVMTRDVKTLNPETEILDALRLMLERQFRHAPLVDGAGKVVGMLSLRDLLRYQVDELDRELNSVIERFTNDSPGG